MIKKIKIDPAGAAAALGAAEHAAVELARHIEIANIEGKVKQAFHGLSLAGRKLAAVDGQWGRKSAFGRAVSLHNEDALLAGFIVSSRAAQLIPCKMPSSQETPMSDADNSSFAGFGKFVPGFDFLQNLATQSAASAAPKNSLLPSLSSWVAPTLNVEEIDKRIAELKAVQFWLDQNATALKATIQALEVQKMTLATLEGMNFHMADIANAFKLTVPLSTPPIPPTPPTPVASPVRNSFAGMEIPAWGFPAAKPVAPAEAVVTPAPAPAPAPAETVTAAVAPAAPAGVVDPLQWWGALTQQFQSIAAEAMKEVVSKTAPQGPDVNPQKPASAARAVPTKSAKSTPLRSAQAWPTPQAAAAVKPAARKPASKAATQASAKPVVKAVVKAAATPAVKSRSKSTPKLPPKSPR